MAKLITENPELLIYLDGKLHITVLGGIKLTGLDRLKVTLKLIKTDNKQNAYRHNLDLYNGIQTEQLIEKASEALDISTSETGKTIGNLTTELENHRATRLEEMKPKQAEKRDLSEAERKQAITFLKSPNLLQRTNEAIKQSGLIGEETNSLIALPDLYEQETPCATTFNVSGRKRERKDLATGKSIGTDARGGQTGNHDPVQQRFLLFRTGRTETQTAVDRRSGTEQKPYSTHYVNCKASAKYPKR